MDARANAEPLDRSTGVTWPVAPVAPASTMSPVFASGVNASPKPPGPSVANAVAVPVPRSICAASLDPKEALLTSACHVPAHAAGANASTLTTTIAASAVRPQNRRRINEHAPARRPSASESR